MKDFSFAMFHDKTKFCKKRWNDIITIEEVCIRNKKWFNLRNEESIVNKWKNKNGNIKIF